MITVPTSKFVDLLADAAIFACPHDELIDIYVVRLEWDGEMLHASSTDTLRTCRVSWDPDDDEEGDNSKKAMLPYWGGSDDRWVMFIRLDEALELVTHFKLPKKGGPVALTLDHAAGKLTVSRNADTGFQHVTVDVVTRMVQFPNIQAALDDPPLGTPVRELDFIRSHLGAFDDVRQRGLARMTFNGPTGAVTVRIGKRFIGTVRPDLSATPRQKALAFDAADA